MVDERSDDSAACHYALVMAIWRRGKPDVTNTPASSSCG
jgi:hypothetical protein